MIQNSGPKNWSTYTWYQVGTDLGAGASATIFDADILGYFMNGGDNKEKGNLGFHAFAANPAAKAPTPNVWIWSLAMNSFGKQKDAAWYFMQWASSTEHDMFGARKMDFVNPVRASVWKDDEFREPHRQVLHRLSRAVRRLGAGRQDLLHAAAAVLRRHHPMGGDAAEDGRQGGAGRRRPRPARRLRSTSSSRTPASADEPARRGARGILPARAARSGCRRLVAGRRRRLPALARAGDDRRTAPDE